MRVIVSDTSPIRYLVLIEEAYLLQKLYGSILLPDAVHLELQQPGTPDAVREWAQTPPAWVQVIRDLNVSTNFPIAAALDAG